MNEQYAEGRETYLHREIAEAILGHKLPLGAEVHPANSIKKDNSHRNLVICPNKAYHLMLHYREKALDACGNPSYRKCEYCKGWDDPNNMMIQDRGKHGIRARHRSCHAEAMRKRKGVK